MIANQKLNREREREKKRAISNEMQTYFAFYCLFASN